MSSGRARGFPDQQTVLDRDDAVDQRLQPDIVADHDDGASLIMGQDTQGIGDQGTTLPIERRGGLVGQDDGRVVRERARDGDTLALATTELCRKEVGARRHAEAVEQPAGSILGGGTVPAQEVERDGDVFPGLEGREEIIRLEHEADRLDPDPPQFLDREPVDPDVVKRQSPGGRLLQRAEELQQRGLSASRRAADHQDLAGPNVERYATQRRDRGRALAVAHVKVARPNDAVVHGRALT